MERVYPIEKVDSATGASYKLTDQFVTESTHIDNIPQNEQKVNSDISTNSNMQNTEKDTHKAVKKAIAPLQQEIKALRKEISDIKAPIKEIEHQQKLYEDIENDDVIQARLIYDKKFADKSIDQLQQIKRKLNHTIENSFKANKKN